MYQTIALRYGVNLKKLANQYVQEQIHLAKFHSHRDFVRFCSKENLVPKYVQNSIHLSNMFPSHRTLVHKMRKDLLLSDLKDLTKKCCALHQKVKRMEDELRREMNHQLFVALVDTGSRSYVNEKFRSQRMKARKIKDLVMQRKVEMVRRNSNTPKVMDSTRTVINLASKAITQNEYSLLSKGPDYKLASKKNEIVSGTISSLESAMEWSQRKNNLTSSRIEEFRRSACNEVASSLQSLPKLGPIERDALSSLKNDGERVVIPGDKSKACIVMDRGDYEKALLKYLSPPDYTPASPADVRKYNSIFQEVLLDLYSGYKAGSKPKGINRDAFMKKDKPRSYQEYTQVRKTFGFAGKFYLLAKTHKDDLPTLTNSIDSKEKYLEKLRFRPIGPGYASIDQNVSKLLTRILQALPRPPCEIRNSKPIFNFMRKNPCIANKGFLFSIDVVNLYPSVPIKETLEVIGDLLKSPNMKMKLSEISVLSPVKILHLLELVMENTFVQVDIEKSRQIFKQSRGVCMGKSLSPEFALLFMGFWERNIKKTAMISGGSLPFIKRYVDDYLGFWVGSEDSFQKFVRNLKMQHAHIDITVEREDKSQIPYLDVFITRKSNGFDTTVFRKSSFSGRLQPFDSHTDVSYLRSSLSSYIWRAKKYCSNPELLRSELSFIQNLFMENGYPSRLVKREVRKGQYTSTPKSEGNKEKKSEIRIPMEFSGDLFYRLKRKARMFLGVQLVARSSRSIKSSLLSVSKARIPVQESSDVIYGINCSCKQIYIGQTKRDLGTRVREHKQSWCRSSSSSQNYQVSSSFGLHRECVPSFDSPIVFGTDRSLIHRLLKESMWIKRIKTDFPVMLTEEEINRNLGRELPSIWSPIVDQLDIPKSLSNV